MITLSIDAALAACSAAVLDGDRVLAVRSEPMTRGHQERLAPMVAELMAEAGLAFDRLERIGVTVGPGSFTGLRVGLAFAKGLALALDIPCVGVTSLAALAASVGSVEPGVAIAACVDAKRDQVYLQLFRDGAALGEPEALSLDEAILRLAGVGPLILCGSGGPLLAPHVASLRVIDLEAADPAATARLAARVANPIPPRPLYLRAPDARLPS